MSLYAGKLEVKYIGALHLRNLYKMMHDWIVENEYVPTRHDYDFPEEFYWETKSTAGTGEVVVWWRCHREIADNPFYRKYLRINLHTFRQRDVDIMQNGKKYSVQWAEFKVSIHGFLEIDYKKEWKRSPFMRLFYNVFVHRIMHHSLHHAWKKEVLKDMYSLQQEIKQFYDTQHFEMAKQAFWPKRGLSELAQQRE